MNKTWMLDTCICSFIMREQLEAVLKRLAQAVLRGNRKWSRPSPTPRFASVPPVRRPRRATFSWSMNSAPASMPSCPGTAPRWTSPLKLRWRSAWPSVVRGERPYFSDIGRILFQYYERALYEYVYFHT